MHYPQLYSLNLEAVKDEALEGVDEIVRVHDEIEGLVRFGIDLRLVKHFERSRYHDLAS